MKRSIGAEVLDVAATAQSAFHAAVGAQSVALLRRRTAHAAMLSAELGARYHAAGNLTPRGLALERSAASEARLAALDAAIESTRARTALAEVLGLDTGTQWEIPDGPDLPLAAEEPLDDVLDLARRSRLDLAAARGAVHRHADRLGVTNWTRWLGNIQLGAERERETDGTFLSGGTATLELPLFTQHRDRQLRVDADLAIAAAEYRRIELDVENGIRLSHAAVENAKARVSEFQAHLIPQRIEALARAQEEAHFMLIGVFELLAAKRREFDAYQGYIEALRDYWIARAALGRAAGTILPADRDGERRRLDIAAMVSASPGTERDHASSHAPHEHNGQDEGPDTGDVQ